MRNLIFFITLFLVTTIWQQTQAQSAFQFAPDSFAENIETEEIEIIYKLNGTMGNASEELLEVDWKLVDLDLPTQWAKQVIVRDFKFLSLINESPSPIILDANESDILFEIWLFPNGQAACTSFKVVFSEHHTGTVLDTVEYQIAINDSSCITTSTGSIIDETLMIYPNPSSGIFNLSYEGQPDYLTIQNINGQEVLNLKPAPNRQELNLNHLPDGYYLLSLLYPNGLVQTEKLVKMRN